MCGGGLFRAVYDRLIIIADDGDFEMNKNTLNLL